MKISVLASSFKFGRSLVVSLMLIISTCSRHSQAKGVESDGLAGSSNLLMGGRFSNPSQRTGGGAQDESNPYRLFLQKNHTEVEAQVGATAQLHCALTGPLADGMVSWVRRRDYHLLTVGRHVYTSDDRAGVKVVPDASDWILTLRWVRESDAGQYECQVSSHPPQSLMVFLKVKVAWAEIEGESERFIHSGSSLKLVCVLRDITEPPSYVFWYREGRMINYDSKAGVTVKTLKGSSILSVNSVTRRDQGNYSCVASNTNPATVSVHVVQKENPAGLQQETNPDKDSPTNIKSARTTLKGTKARKGGAVARPASSATAVVAVTSAAATLQPLSLPAVSLLETVKELSKIAGRPIFNLFNILVPGLMKMGVEKLALSLVTSIIILHFLINLNQNQRRESIHLDETPPATKNIDFSRKDTGKIGSNYQSR